MLAERTGLEPATPGVTGRYSNQLNYRSELKKLKSIQEQKPSFRTRCLTARSAVVGAERLELPTYAL